jgi:hypothetical protein
MTEQSRPGQPPMVRRGTRLHRETDGSWTLYGEEDVEDLPSLLPIMDPADPAESRLRTVQDGAETD